MRTTTIFAALSALTTTAFAREIVLGTLEPDPLNNGFQVAWISGEDPCHTGVRIIAGKDENPCGERFTLEGFKKLHFEGCGGEGVQIWQDQTFLSDCRFEPQEVGCLFGEKVTGKFICPFG